MEQQVC